MASYIALINKLLSMDPISPPLYKSYLALSWILPPLSLILYGSFIKFKVMRLEKKEFYCYLCAALSIAAFTAIVLGFMTVSIHSQVGVLRNPKWLLKKNEAEAVDLVNDLFTTIRIFTDFGAFAQLCLNIGFLLISIKYFTIALKLRSIFYGYNEQLIELKVRVALALQLLVILSAFVLLSSVSI